MSVAAEVRVTWMKRIHGIAASPFARSSTSRSISGVSFPVKVFCWLTW